MAVSEAPELRALPRLLSVVVPVFNEETGIPELFRRLGNALGGIGCPAEVIVVDDGSDDGTRAEVRRQAGAGLDVTVVSLSRNFGLAGAIDAGLEHARGQVVVLMDGDLQDPPELIPPLLEAWRGGADVVLATRRSRAERGLRRFAFDSFHLVYRRLARVSAPLGAGNFSLMDRRVLESLRELPERNRYLPGLRYWVGFKQVAVTFDREARASGRPKMGPGKLLRLALDGIFGFSHLPLQLATLLGLSAVLIGIACVVWVLVERFITHTAILGWPSLMIAVCLLGGAQLVCIGVLGEYVARIFDEVRARPSFIVRDVVRASGRAPEAAGPRQATGDARDLGQDRGG